ncbi:MAG: hypothetical protein ABEH88_10115 [Halobacteriales archaeon]
MSTDSGGTGMDRLSPSEIEERMGSIKKMLLVGAVFAAVGYLLIGAAIVFELTQFHPLLDSFFSDFPGTSLAGGTGGERGAAVNSELAEIHKWPSTLLWLKLGGVGHILVGIFIALAAIIRVLSLVPHRLSYAMERTQE